MSLADIRKRLDSKEISAIELTRYYLDRIKKYDGSINSFITVCADAAVSDAKRAQDMIDKGCSDALTGIAISVKDNICTEGIKTTCASKMLRDFIPPYSAHAVRKLNKQGAVILGKTNMDEFAMGSLSNTSYFGAVKNPHDLTRVSGGSSGGAAAGVAAGFSSAALGSDTGGSVRQPAAFCGVTGLKPTYGTVSRRGLIAFASSLDQIGIISKSAFDCGYLLNGIYGYDKYDFTSSKKAGGDYTALAGKSISGTKIAIPEDFFMDELCDDVKSAVLAAAEYYERLGCKITTVSLPSLKFAVPAYYLISSAEAASNLSRYDGIKYGFKCEGANYNDMLKKTRGDGFGKEVKRRIILGNYALCSGYYDDYYKRALIIRKQISAEYDEILKYNDVILTPTAPTTAYKADTFNDNPTGEYMSDIYTVTASIAGLPAISTTCGYDKNGMPIGMSLTGRAFDEKTIIAVCDRFERDFSRKEARLV